MYHVIGTGITAILLYLLSYFFYKNDFYSRQYHRKLWNLILASAFIMTAFAGLFLALQINYKWNIPFIKTVLKWHVEFGAGLAITGIFHFLWHFSYYLDILRKNGISPEEMAESSTRKEGISENLFIIGFVSTSVQLLLLKEILNISGGYELIAGTFLGSWLIGSAAGSALASKSQLRDIRKLNLIFFLSPLISIILMVLLARLFLKTGETPSLLAGIIYTFLVLIPFCFVSGFTFVKLISVARAVNKFNPGKSFAVETTGGIAAGILIALLSSGELNTYKSLLIVILLGTSYAVLTFLIVGKMQSQIVRVITLVTAILIITCSPDLFFRQLLIRGVKVTGSKDTPYGNITNADYRGELNTYYNQRLIEYNDDAVEREEDIHYAMIQAERTDNILLISGSINSHLRELEKYNVKNVVYIERDPALTRQGKDQNTDQLNYLTIKNEDAFTFVRNTSQKFDVVIVLLPPPSSLFLNRYYTWEFFNSVRKLLNQGGIYACSPGINPNYFNAESIKLYSSVYNSLKKVFTNVVPVGGNKLYFIASDKSISTSVCQLMEEKKITNYYVSPDYMSDDLIKMKSDEITSLMDRGIKINRSSVPIACFYYQSFNLSKNINERIPVIVLLAVLFILPVLTIKRKHLIMYFSASSLAAFEIILLLVLQLTAGNMYQYTGLILAGIMAGLAAGSGSNFRISGKKSIIKLTFILIAFYLLAGTFIEPLLTVSGRFGITILLILAGFLPSFITGSMFSFLTSQNVNGSTVSNVYNADLTGSAIGFIIFSGLIIPFIGIKSSLFILPILIFTGFLFTAIGNKQ